MESQRVQLVSENEIDTVDQQIRSCGDAITNVQGSRGESSNGNERSLFISKVRREALVGKIMT